MRKGKGRILGSSLSELITRFSQQNIVEEIEKRYQSAPAKLIPISQIDDNAFVAAAVIPEETTEYFAERLREKGFYTPLVVRTKEDGRYEIILGRKRFYGARKAGMLSLPCAFAEVEDEEVLLMLLADTRDQREANVVEMALVCRALQEKFGYGQQTLAELSHQSRCQISNILRILKLPKQLQEAVCVGRLSYGHGRALASLSEDEAAVLGKRVLEEGLSVREVESIIKQMRQGGNADAPYSLQVVGNEIRIKFKDSSQIGRFLQEKAL